MAEEIINQLVACQGEPSATNEWIERGRTVLLAHPDQIFEGQWRRYNTKMPVGLSPLYWAWERNFVKEASLSVFHKFRQADRLGLRLPCETVTTVLSPGAIPKPLRLNSRDQIFVVPSHRDRTRLMRESHIAAEKIHVVRPTVRRYCFFCESPKLRTDGKILLIGENARYQQRLSSILKGRFPTQSVEALSFKGRKEVEPLEWLKLIDQTAFAVYLVDKPYDWATLALELFYWGVPVVFPDENGPLNELLPLSPLRLSSFLVNQPDLSGLKKMAEEAGAQLDEANVFEPLSFARQYGKIYSSLPQRTQ